MSRLGGTLHSTIARKLFTVTVAALLLTMASCNGAAMGQSEPQMKPSGTPMGTSPAMATPSGGGMMGDGREMGGEQALGGTAMTQVLGDERVMTLPSGPLAWVAHESAMPAAARPITHRHALGFVYAADGAHTVVIQGREIMLQPGQAVFVGQEVEHTHQGQGRFWDIRLTSPDDGPPPEMENAERVFASPQLEGIPQTPVQVRFIRVELPPNAQTSVHTHPGSEYIYVTQGDIVYQNAIVGVKKLGEGDDHALPPDTAVQKRNPEGGRAIFLSWFVVDPESPFAPEASFQ